MDAGNNFQYGDHIPVLSFFRDLEDLQDPELWDHRLVAALQGQYIPQRDVCLCNLHIPLAFDIDRFLISRHDILHPAF